MHWVLFNLCLSPTAAVRGELFWTLFDSGTNGFVLDEHGPSNGEWANNCLLKCCWLLASSAKEKKTIVFHIHCEMSCQIAVVLWKRSFVGFRGWHPGFQFKVLWCCYCFIWRARSGLTLYWRISGNKQMYECSRNLNLPFFLCSRDKNTNIKC